MRRGAARRHEGENEVVGKIAPSYVRSRRSFVAVFTRGYGLFSRSHGSIATIRFIIRIQRSEINVGSEDRSRRC